MGKRERHCAHFCMDDCVCVCLLQVVCSVQLLIHTFVEPANMPSVFACLDVLVSPFTRPATETFGLVNIEANAMRVPFVHFGTGGIQVCVASIQYVSDS